MADDPCVPMIVLAPNGRPSALNGSGPDEEVSDPLPPALGGCVAVRNTVCKLARCASAVVVGAGAVGGALALLVLEWSVAADVVAPCGDVCQAIGIGAVVSPSAVCIIPAGRVLVLLVRAELTNERPPRKLVRTGLAAGAVELGVALRLVECRGAA